jgi:hypothetical protein
MAALAVDSTGRCNTWILIVERRRLYMEYRTRIQYIETDKALMWER